MKGRPMQRRRMQRRPTKRGATQRRPMERRPMERRPVMLRPMKPRAWRLLLVPLLPLALSCSGRYELPEAITTSTRTPAALDAGVEPPLGSLRALMIAGRAAIAAPHAVSTPPAPPPATAVASPPDDRDLDAGERELRPVAWYDLVLAASDRERLRDALVGTNDRDAKRTLAIAAIISEGVGQPACRYFSLDDTGFVPSQGHFWPASTIKPWAAVGALVTLRAYGIDGAARLHFTDAYGTFDAPLSALYASMVNENFDRLLLVAGLDPLNSFPDRRRYGLPHIVLQAGYGGGGSVRQSPPITFSEGGRTGTIPARTAKLKPPGCASNCTTLFEVQEVLRRIVLHDELPSFERFPITDADAQGLRQSLLDHTPKKIETAAQEVLGPGTQHFNKSGSLRGRDNIENVLLIPKQGGERYLVTLSVPWPMREVEDKPSLRAVDRLGRLVLLTLDQAGDGASATSLPPPLQADAGESLLVSVREEPSSGDTAQVRVRTALGLDSLELWRGATPVPVARADDGAFVATLRRDRDLTTTLVLLGSRQGKKVAFRSLQFDWSSATAPPLARRHVDRAGAGARRQ